MCIVTSCYIPSSDDPVWYGGTKESVIIGTPKPGINNKTV